MGSDDRQVRVVPMDEHALQAFRAEVIGRKNLPTIPTVLAKIVQLADAEASSSRDLVEVIEHDQALTGRILRLANSAFFGQTRRVATIPRALVLLGFATVRNLAVGVKVWESLGGGLSRIRLDELWGHAVAVAVAAKWATGRLRAGDPDQAFTAGLLHDVGRLVMAMRLGDVYWTTLAAAPPGEPVEAVEAATFGVDHAEVGGWMLEAWNLPAGIVDAVRQHHAALRTGLPATLALANRLVGLTDLATRQCHADAGELFAPLLEHGITPEAWDELLGALSGDGLLAMNG